MSTGLLNETEQVTLFLAAENSRKRFALKGDMLIGRDPACNIVIQSLHISRYHAKIISSEQGATIEDLSSANGTFINGLRLEGKAPLRVGDLLCFDDHAFRILAQDSIAPPAIATHALQPELAAVNKVAESPASYTVSPIKENVLAEADIVMADPIERILPIGLTETPSAQNSFSEPTVLSGGASTHSREPESKDPIIAAVFDHDASLNTIRRPSAKTPADDDFSGFFLDDIQDNAKEAIQESVGDVTRPLTYHEMKELLRWSQNTQDPALSEEPRFIVETPPLKGKEIPLLPLDMDTRWKIGRDLTSKICLRDKSIEIDHAYISRNPSGFRLTATSAAKSYILNGQSLRDSYLHDGDIIQLGRITLRFQTDVISAAEPSKGSKPAPIPETNGKGELKNIKWYMAGTAAFLLVVILAVVVFSPKG